MKTEYAKVFAAAAMQKVVKSNEVGTKTTWTTEDHLRALATCLSQKEVPTGDGQPEFYEVLSDCYNVSAFAQFLEKKFQGTGHFVRRDGKKQTVSELDAMFDAQIAEMGKK